MQNIVFTDESLKRQITDSSSENLADTDLESSIFQFREKRITLRIFVSKNTKLYNNDMKL